MSAPRIADHPIDQTYIERWSPRAFDGSALAKYQLLSLFEAARWAPSAYNVQPGRFVYALRNTPEWTALLATLVYILSDTQFTPPGKTDPAPATTASFDTGAAWAALAHQAQLLGLHTHAMAGFDVAVAAQQLGSGTSYHIEGAVAIGRIGDPASLPEALRAREFPSPRLSVSEIAFAGTLPQA